ncbi:MAG: hypothetical protein SOZ59_00600 [Candidatus Limivivens sp.]|nr:hypothetical protein [Candidatus Limivivens sp.]
MSRTQQRGNSFQTKTYIDGNTVRRVQYTQAVPREQPARQTRPKKRTAAATRKNRERALQMNIGYVAFLTVAAVASLFVSVNYLKLHAQSTNYRNEITALESQYSSLKLANDEDYARTISSVDLEYVRNVAINKLGMVYASAGQVVTYHDQEGDFVRQYEDVPEE